MQGKHIQNVVVENDYAFLCRVFRLIHSFGELLSDRKNPGESSLIYLKTAASSNFIFPSFTMVHIEGQVQRRNENLSL